MLAFSNFEITGASLWATSTPNWYEVSIMPYCGTSTNTNYKGEKLSIFCINIYQNDYFRTMPKIYIYIRANMTFSRKIWQRWSVQRINREEKKKQPNCLVFLFVESVGVCLIENIDFASENLPFSPQNGTTKAVSPLFRCHVVFAVVVYFEQTQSKRGQFTSAHTDTYKLFVIAWDTFNLHKVHIHRADIVVGLLTVERFCRRPQSDLHESEWISG